MRRETAYKLAGRRHGVVAARLAATRGIEKVREIRFKALPPGQTAQARESLARLPGLQVEAGRDERTLIVRYRVLDYSLRMLEDALAEAGFGLDGSLWTKLRRALIHYVEDTQVHTLRSPERLIKQSHEIYIRAYAAHPHGDHDDTPPELRDFR